MTQPRYALYFTPPVESQFWQSGSAWIGRDAACNAPIKRPMLANVGADTLVAITQHPRRYGFHATLKAPFHLAEGSNVDLLLEHVVAFASARTSFMLPRLRVAIVEDFLALVPAEHSRQIDLVARTCVDDFDRHRRPLTDAQLAQRRVKNLSARQDELLRRWGYPHVFDDYRFHLTLTDSLCGTHDRFATQIREAAEKLFTDDTVGQHAFDSISVFKESRPGADFQQILRAPFGKQGRLIYVVGPSGAGKDSLLQWANEHLQTQRGIMFARRAITRPTCENGEQHEAVSEAQFSALEAKGVFAMAWQAHGFQYGIRCDIDGALALGKTVVVNGSRTHLPTALAAYPFLEVVHITAPDTILEQRLRARGRENTAQMSARGLRTADLNISEVQHTEIVNASTLSDAGFKLLKYLTQE
jgi:phosphonate metabolism protein PhnN/1,5-bisphosphokinase (PRPP-forming)